MLLKRQSQKLKSIVGLSLSLAKAQFKLRNEGTWLGILWYLLNPILMFGLLFFIFSTRLGNNILNYPFYLLLGIIMFNFFQSATIESTKSIVSENNQLIKSINFPKESLIGGIVFKTLFSHLFEIILFIVLLLFFKISLMGVLYYFIILLFFLIFIFSSCLILSSLTVYFADLENIWQFGVRLIWFGTPIFYAIEGQTRLFYLNLLNPMYYFITIARDLIIYMKIPEMWMILVMIGYSLLFLLIGLFLFNYLKGKFAEMI